MPLALAIEARGARKYGDLRAVDGIALLVPRLSHAEDPHKENLCISHAVRRF